MFVHQSETDELYEGWIDIDKILFIKKHKSGITNEYQCFLMGFNNNPLTITKETFDTIMAEKRIIENSDYSSNEGGIAW